MKIRTKIILSFLLVIIIVSVPAVFSKIIIDKTQSEIQTIKEIESAFDEQHISTVNYISGNQPVNAITDSHIFIQHQLSVLIASSGQHEENLHKLQELELTVYDKETNENQSDSLTNLLNTRDFAFKEFLEKNNSHIIRISEFKKYWGDHTTQDTLDNILISIDKERQSVIEFDPNREDFEDIRNNFREMNDNIVDSLVILLTTELDFVISSIDENDSQLQQTRSSLISQRDIVSQITATSFPSVQNKQALLAMIEPSKEIQFSDVEDMTVSIGKSCESNIQSLEDVGIIIYQRQNVKEVGENKNPIQVLISVIKCQQGLRANAEDYMNSEIMIKDILDDIIMPTHVQFDDLIDQTIFELNSPFSNTSLMLYGLFTVTILLIIIFGITLSNSISKPIRKLIDASNRISTENEFVNIPSEGVEECRILSDSFNYMIHTINESTKDLKNFKDVLDQSSLVAITDKDGIITYANDKFCELSKYSRDELIGKNHRILKSGYHDESFYENMWNTISSGKTWYGIIKNKAKDGTYYWVQSTIMPFKNEQGDIEKYIAVRTDITSQIELAEKLAKSERLSSIGQLSARIAHDIRNPLSVIKVTLDNFKLSYNMDDVQQKQMARVNRSVDRITHQIDDVLDFVRGSPVEFSKTKLSKIIAESMDSLTVPNNIKLILPKNDVTLLCDVKQFSAMLNNLILNGIQSIEGTGTIEITVKENDDEIIIKVKDSGKGIPKENLDKIFEPLFTTKQTGTGLGLASVKAIIDAHKGVISVTSPPTIFKITLPKILE